jgi:hypothetical protein
MSIFENCSVEPVRMARDQEALFRRFRGFFRGPSLTQPSESMTDTALGRLGSGDGDGISAVVELQAGLPVRAKQPLSRRTIRCHVPFGTRQSSAASLRGHLRCHFPFDLRLIAGRPCCFTMLASIYFKSNDKKSERHLDSTGKEWGH